jgi:hypothetical protein
MGRTPVSGWVGASWAQAERHVRQHHCSTAYLEHGHTAL